MRKYSQDWRSIKDAEKRKTKAAKIGIVKRIYYTLFKIKKTSLVEAREIRRWRAARLATSY